MLAVREPRAHGSNVVLAITICMNIGMCAHLVFGLQADPEDHESDGLWSSSGHMAVFLLHLALSVLVTICKTPPAKGLRHFDTKIGPH